MRVVTAASARLRQWLCGLRPTVILACGWLVLVFYAYPGVMTMDSFDQLREGREWFFTDSHPPAMAALWGLVDRLIAGPFGMLVIQSAAFLAGIYLILLHAMRPRRAALWACAVLVFPPVLTPLAVIWKDCLMAGFLVLGIAGLLDSRRWIRGVALGALSVATAMRYNAPAATLPLVVLLFEWRPTRAWKRYALAVGAWVAITAAAFGLNAVLVDRKMYFWYSSLAIGDIVGTLAHVDDDLPDAELRRELAPTRILVDQDIHAKIRAIYRPYDFQQLLTGDGHLWDLPLSGPTPAPEPVRDAIGRAWWDLVTAHPGAFVRYRFAAFAEALGTTHRRLGGTVVLHSDQYPGMLAYMGIGERSSSFQRAGEHVTTVFAKRTRLFRPVLYALLSLALLAMARRHRDVLAILLSGIALELTLLPLVQTPDYRYSHWLVVCTCLAVVMLVARRARDIAPRNA